MDARDKGGGNYKVGELVVGFISSFCRPCHCIYNLKRDQYLIVFVTDHVISIYSNEKGESLATFKCINLI